MKNINNIIEDNSDNLMEKSSKNINKYYFPSKAMNNNFEINNEKNKLKTYSDELGFNYNKENFLNIEPIKEQNETKKNNVDYSSEIIKFKTEICHSWELSGTCKYGVNVSLFSLILITF